MKSRLMSSEQLEELTQVRTLSVFVSELTRTPYRRAAEIASIQATGIAQVADLVRANVIETLGRVRTFYSDEAQQHVDFLLQRYDIQNLKTILRGLAQNIAIDEISAALMPIGRLTTNVLDELIDAGDIHSAIDTIVTLGDPLAQPLLVLRAERPGWATWEMELLLEKWYLDPERCSGYSSKLMDFFSLEADIINIMTMLRFANIVEQSQIIPEDLVVSLEELLVPSGTLSNKRLMKIGSAHRIEDAINELSDTPYYSALQAGYTLYHKNKQLSVIERSLLHYQLKKYATGVASDPLGISVPIGYFSLKENEGRNLRQIAWGVHLGHDSDSIFEQLEIV